MSRSDARAKQKLHERSLHALRVEEIDALKQERDAKIKKLWEQYQRRIRAMRERRAA